MAGIDELEKTVQKLASQVEIGEQDPLAINLEKPYRSLRELEAAVARKIDVDETLNTLLENKTTRIQELARILASPEVYVNRIKILKPMKLAKLISYRQPVTYSQLDVDCMQESFSRIQDMMAARKESMLQEEQVPSITEPEDKKMEMEDSVTIEDLNQFLKKIPENQPIGLQELLASPNMDEFLRRFLYVVLLISRGLLGYDGEKVRKTEIEER
ncbi:MAG: hypothetical protein GF309_09690 [Candidatus Lokiarchaeota archaeon]|nr:hypothetical protein [Candidatus Lokiarchaeota archaeon]